MVVTSRCTRRLVSLREVCMLLCLLGTGGQVSRCEAVVRVDAALRALAYHTEWVAELIDGDMDAQGPTHQI